nr:MAG TPA: hypothetical protein [Caudoviricetes sp.]
MGTAKEKGLSVKLHFYKYHFLKFPLFFLFCKQVFEEVKISLSKIFVKLKIL